MQLFNASLGFDHPIHHKIVVCVTRFFTNFLHDDVNCRMYSHFPKYFYSTVRMYLRTGVPWLNVSIFHAPQGIVYRKVLRLKNVRI